MSEETLNIINDAVVSMKKATEHFESELTKIRAGKANPTMLDGITVDYYGTPTAINQVGNLSAIDARTLTIQPWEKICCNR
jgi:ribosome recycling factor